ncbi:threonine aldolase [Azospirillum fermentarium]|uniref:threonine aldolase family protein n=1 Tax=Azospirillum fermentarium TaxID=1233114 RepID=UPI002227A874|nr:low specificity L-threonine aldolase [Azospirillum fermentarium]MCW2246990.1 threonine aldolase [Azospirillum fermentarium]
MTGPLPRGYDFRSDNVAGVAPAVMAALTAASTGTAPSYGADPWTARLTAQLSALFEREVAVFPLVTGTGANALALAGLVPPWGAVLCHEESHITADECNAPEAFTGGAKLVGLPGAHGKLTPDTVTAALERAGIGIVHHAQPAALSITQATEAGTVYTPDEITALSAAARGFGLSVHMDGARFANAVAHLGCSPADVTWRAGVDMLSLGATKGGAMMAEALVVFDPARAEGLAFRRKRAGHLVSKMRFVSAQVEAWLTDGLWLRLAAHANTQARRLADGLTAAGYPPVHPVEANEVFVPLPDTVLTRLEAAGYLCHRWDGASVRFVTAFDTPPWAVDGAVAAVRG